MSGLLTKAIRIYQDEGGQTLIRRGSRYLFNDFVRPLLPKRIRVYNGVVVRDRLPFERPVVRPGYEVEIISQLRTHVDPGDAVTIVGGGRGASAVVAGRHTKEHGSVNVYEGGRDRASSLAETIQLNGVDGWVNPHHAVVGSPVNVWGEHSDANTVDPSSLPECDILELDCEGSETEILEKLQIRPPVIIVETHEVDEPTDNCVYDSLVEMGYEVEDIGVENREFGCYILTAIRDQ